MAAEKGDVYHYNYCDDSCDTARLGTKELYVGVKKKDGIMMDEKKNSDCHNKLYFGKNEANIIKGVLILLMVIHHLFGLVSSPSYMDDYLWKNIGTFGKICVSAYAFSSGYGLFVSVQNKKKELFIQTAKRILLLFLKYWICLTLILVVDFCMGRIDISILELIKIILCYLGIFCTYNANAWFILPYVVFVVLFPGICFLLQKIRNKIWQIIMELLLIFVPLTYSVASYFYLNEVNFIYNTVVYNIILILPFFSIGYFFARHNFFGKIKCFQKDILNLALGIFLIACVFFARKAWNVPVYGMNVLDIIYAPILIVSLVLISNNIKIKCVKDMFFKLGKMSTNIWLIHYVFCQGALSGVVSFSDFAIITFIITISLCIFSSYFIDLIYNFISKYLKLT